jgi:hypothetical protein
MKQENKQKAFIRAWCDAKDELKELEAKDGRVIVCKPVDNSTEGKQ